MGLCPPTSNSADVFVQGTYPKVSSSYVYSLEVMALTNKQANKQTNKQTDAAENIQRSSLRYDVG